MGNRQRRSLGTEEKRSPKRSQQRKVWRKKTGAGEWWLLRWWGQCEARHHFRQRDYGYGNGAVFAPGGRHEAGSASRGRSYLLGSRWSERGRSRSGRAASIPAPTAAKPKWPRHGLPLPIIMEPRSPVPGATAQLRGSGAGRCRQGAANPTAPTRPAPTEYRDKDPHSCGFLKGFRIPGPGWTVAESGDTVRARPIWRRPANKKYPGHRMRRPGMIGWIRSGLPTLCWWRWGLDRGVIGHWVVGPRWAVLDRWRTPMNTMAHNYWYYSVVTKYCPNLLHYLASLLWNQSCPEIWKVNFKVRKIQFGP